MIPSQDVLYQAKFYLHVILTNGDEYIAELSEGDSWTVKDGGLLIAVLVVQTDLDNHTTRQVHFSPHGYQRFWVSTREEAGR